MNIKKNRSLNKLTLIGFITASLTIGLLAFSHFQDPNANILTGSDGGVNEIMMTAANGPTESGSYTSVTEHPIRYVNFDYFGVKAGGGYHAVLAQNGYIGNNRQTRLTSITSITVTYTADSPMKIAFSNRNDGLGLNEKVTIASGVELVPENAPYYFRLYAGNVETSVTSIEIHYTCVEQAPNTYFVDNLSKQYSGVLGTTVFVVTRNGSGAVLETKNLETNIVINGGQISIVGDEITIAASGLSYFGTLSDNGHTITYKNATGTYKNHVTGLNLKAVYMLEDYESYSGSGLGIRQAANGMYGHTQLRGAYYSDYHDGSSGSPLGGTGWKLMGSTDYIDILSDAHSGTKAAKYKRSSAGAMRHISWNLYTGAALVQGKGDTFSFWAKGVASDVSMKPRVSYVSKITASNQESTTDTAFAELTIPASSPWTQYSFPINPAKQVYGFQFSLISAAATVYLPIDDVQIYTSANPWVEYNPIVSVTGVSVSPKTASVEAGKTVSLSATVLPANATNQAVVWSSANTAIATVNQTTGIVTGVDEGQVSITATTADGGYTDSCLVSVTMPLTGDDSPLGKTFNAIATVNPPVGGPISVSIIIAFAEDYRAFVKIGDDLKETTYTIEDNVVTFDTLNSNVGIFVGEFNAARTTLTKTSISGGYGSYISTLVLNAALVLEDGNDTTTAALQQKYSIQFGGGWSNSTSPDRITYKTNNPDPIEGSGYAQLKILTSEHGEMRYKAKNMTQSLGTFKNFGMWFYNNTGASMTVKMYVYEASADGNGQNHLEFAKFNIPSNGAWTFYTSGFGTTKPVAGWSIILPVASAVGYPCIDNVVLF